MPKASRKIAAILAADIVDYSRLMGVDDEGTLAALKERRAIFDRLVSEFDGLEFGSVGDSLMAQFPSAVNAVRCTQAVQYAIAQANESIPADRRMSLRIGVNLGDVIEENGALFGDGVNVAARLQSLADPGGILVSGSVYEQVKNKLGAHFTFVGARQVKNIIEPVKTYKVSEPAVRHLGHRIAAFLWRRGVVAAAVYILVSWTSVWAYGRLAATFMTPPWMLPAMITFLSGGFVPAVAIAWRFDRRQPAAPWVRILAVSIASVASVAVTWSAWHSYADERARTAISPLPPKSQPVVAVGEFRNLTPDPNLNWLSEGIANLVRDGLAESRHLVVVSPTRWQAVLRSIKTATPTQADVLGSAGRARIDYVVSGEFLPGPEGLLLTARLSDVQGGVEIAPHRAERLSPQTLLAEAARLVLMAKRGLGVPHTETVASFSADFAVNNMTAYEVYLNGMDYFLKFDYRSAEHAFRSALRVAPDFYMARYRLAQVQVSSGDTETALSTLDQIPADAPLTRRERLYVDGARAVFARNATQAKAIYTTVIEEFPFDTEGRLLLAQAHDLAFENEAAIVELKRLLDQEPENDYVWSYLGETYLRLGEYDLARNALDEYLKLQPRDPFGFTVLGQLDQLTGNLEPAAERFAHALELEPGFVPARLAFGQTQVLRNDWTGAERLLRALVADREAPAISRIDAAFDLSALLRAQGRFADSLEPLQELEPEIRKEQNREAMALAERGIAQAELGRFAEAGRLIERAIERFPDGRTRYLFARGSVLLMQGDTAGVRTVAATIRDQQFPPDSAVARENAIRAAAYLTGMAGLGAGDAAEAATDLTLVVAMPGYQYAIYKLGLARALLAEGELSQALELARAAANERDAGDIRMDLELDRSRALLLEAEILAALGKRKAAAERARIFLRRWSNADSGRRERVRAERLAATGQLALGGDLGASLRTGSYPRRATGARATDRAVPPVAVQVAIDQRRRRAGASRGRLCDE
ncbi:MAG: tetratricopeptide repeat protein [Steroidobacteraceae bacterium]